MRKFALSAVVVLSGLCQTAFASVVPKIADQVFQCDGEAESYTISIQNKLSNFVFSGGQYLAIVTQKIDAKSFYVILDQHAISTRTEVGWSMSFVNEELKFSYRSVMVEGKPSVGGGQHVFASMMTTDGPIYFNSCKLVSPNSCN